MTRQPLWRSTPPAAFPVILGLLGLSLSWRGLGSAFGFTAAIGDLLLGIAVAMFIFFAASYLAKFIVRPGVLAEDLKSPPGRAGLSAISMGMIVLSAGLLPYGNVAHWVWWAGVLLHVAILTLVMNTLSKTPPEGRSPTPFQYLPFVGLITAPIAGVPLGYDMLSQALAYLSFIAFLVLTYQLAAKLLRGRPPQALRPPLVIFLAPLSLFGMAFGQFGPEIGFTVFYVLAWVAALVLLALARWITEAGFTPMWGALTFPITTFVNINLMAMGKGMGVIATTGAIAGTLIGTPLILYIAYRAMKMWAKRDLAKKTGAAVA